MLSDRDKNNLIYLHKICLLAKNHAKMLNSSNKTNGNIPKPFEVPFDQNNLTVTLAVPEHDELTESHFDEISLGSQCEFQNSSQLQPSECDSIELKSESPSLLEKATSSFPILHQVAGSRFATDVSNDNDQQDKIESQREEMIPIGNETEHQYDFISEQFQANNNIANRSLNTPNNQTGTQINNELNHQLKSWDLLDIGVGCAPKFERSNWRKFSNSPRIKKSLSISNLFNVDYDNTNDLISASLSLPNINFSDFSAIKNSRVPFCRNPRHELICRANDFIDDRVRVDSKSTQTNLSNKHVMTNTAHHIYDDLNFLENDFNNSPLYESISINQSEIVHSHTNTKEAYKSDYVDKSIQAVKPVSNALTCTETTSDHFEHPENDSQKFPECQLNSANLEVARPAVNCQFDRPTEMTDSETQYNINDCEFILHMNNFKNICINAIPNPENFGCDFCRSRPATTGETTSPTLTNDSAIQCEYELLMSNSAIQCQHELLMSDSAIQCQYEPLNSYSAMQLSMDPLTDATIAVEAKPIANNERLHECEQFPRYFVDAATECDLALPNAHECRCNREPLSDVKFKQLPVELSIKHYSEASTECDLAFATKFDSFSQTVVKQTHEVESQCNATAAVQENELNNFNKMGKHISNDLKNSESKFGRDFGCQKVIPAFTKGIQNVPHQKAIGTQARAFVKHYKQQFPEICKVSDLEEADSSGDENLEFQEIGSQDSKISFPNRPYNNEFDCWNNSDWMPIQSNTELMRTDKLFLKLDERKACLRPEN